MFSRSQIRRSIVAALAAIICALPFSVYPQQATESGIIVTGEPVSTPHPHDDTRPKLEHIMREVSETQVTVTKKATVIHLDKEAPVQANNLQQLFTKAPGLIEITSLGTAWTIEKA